MRGDDDQQLGVFSYVSPEQRVPQEHPLRPIRAMADEALRHLQPIMAGLDKGMEAMENASPQLAPHYLMSMRNLLMCVSASQKAGRIIVTPLCKPQT